MSKHIISKDYPNGHHHSLVRVHGVDGRTYYRELLAFYNAQENACLFVTRYGLGHQMGGVFRSLKHHTDCPAVRGAPHYCNCEQLEERKKLKLEAGALRPVRLVCCYQRLRRVTIYQPKKGECFIS